ncbi:hypothetical protein Pfo_006984 [Paulownia fortunei]|nr:hypothetical protein Pfo_006984 [Paulownia fortunei]
MSYGLPKSELMGAARIKNILIREDRSEINIGPWDEEFQSIKKGSKRRSWARKLPIAYWKGNPDVVSPIRMELLQCNDTKNWRAQIMRQDWEAAARGGFKESKLSKQCDNRYKIYAEGYAWSVSLKYILSCGCCTLIISPEYEDFFSRGLIPKKNYLPIPSSEMCQAIKSAVDWGNSHPSEAEAIGRAAQDFMGSLSMDGVYDYMYHLLTEYSKLQAFTPVRPSTALEITLWDENCNLRVFKLARPHRKLVILTSYYQEVEMLETYPSSPALLSLRPTPLATQNLSILIHMRRFPAEAQLSP